LASDDTFVPRSKLEMSEITLTAKTNRETGTRATRRLRREGLIPAVVYGHGMDAVSVAVDGPDLRVALNGEAGLNQLIELNADGKSYLVLAKVLQRHPVRGTLQHVDFQITSRDETVTVEVPITVIGDAVEVRHAGGAIDQQVYTITVAARPADIPTNVDVDISHLLPGDIFRIADLVLPAGVAAVSDPETAIAIAHGARAVEAEGGAPVEAAETAEA
jgi:large subunit ribosomal protein L25